MQKSQLIAAALGLAALVGGLAAPAQAGQCRASATTDCGRENTPVKGKPPTWSVSYCFVWGIGSPGNRTKVPCGTSVRDSLVCFVASDGHEYHDAAWVVHVGRRFFNHRIDGRWQPDWIE